MSVSGPRRRAAGSIAANPVLIGAVTTLVVLVAVFLAYNANKGLPFVPTTQVRVLVPNAAEVVKGNQVRAGGFLIGLVKDMQPETLRDGQTVAEMTLALNKTAGRIPVDSTVTVRPRSLLGLKYVQLNKGISQQYLKDGDTLPITQASSPVELDQVFNTFDQRTREAARSNLVNYGDAVAGRGLALNETINNLPPLLQMLTPVAANLADPRTDLKGFLGASDRLASMVAPVAPTAARLFTDLGTTLGAISHDPQALKDTIAKSPDTLLVGRRSLHDTRPFLRDLAALSADESYAAHQLRLTLPAIDPAIETGTRILPTTPPLFHRLKGTFAAVRDLANTPTTNQALRALTDTVNTLQPQLRYLGPYVTVCNYWNYFWTLISDDQSGFDRLGSTQNIEIKTTQNPQNPNDLSHQGAVRPTNGETPGQFLHVQPITAAVNSQGLADCESGQRGYPMGRWATYSPGFLNAVVDPHIPGLSGPTFKSLDDYRLPLRARALGPNHVPPGETFDVNPQSPNANLPAPLREP